MTIPAPAQPGTTDRKVGARSARHAYRARFWRLAIGGLGLFWVGLMVWLTGALIP